MHPHEEFPEQFLKNLQSKCDRLEQPITFRDTLAHHVQGHKGHGWSHPFS